MNRPSILDTDDPSVAPLSTEEVSSTIRELCTYIRHLEESRDSLKPAALESTRKVEPNSEMNSAVEERLRQQQQEASRRENVLVMRLTAKEQELQEYLNKLEEMRMNAASTSRNVILDPAVNIMFQRMKQELQQAREQAEQSKQELDAWKFTPDSNTGKRLMARCRTLIQENEELGKLCNSGRVGKLEGDLALMRTQCEDLRRTQAEVDDFLLEMEEEMDGLQSTIQFLQTELRKMHEENQRLRSLLGLELEGSLDEELAKRQQSHEEHADGDVEMGSGTGSIIGKEEGSEVGEEEREEQEEHEQEQEEQRNVEEQGIREEEPIEESIKMEEDTAMKVKGEGD